MQKGTVVAFLLLAGCGQKPQIETIVPSGPSPYEAALAECNKIKPSHKMVPTVDCYTNAEVVGHRVSGGPLYTAALAIRVRSLQIAEDHDAGRLSDAQAKAQLELVANEENNKGGAVVAEAIETRKQQDEAADQQRRAAMLETGLALMRGPPTVTCTTLGNTTQCQGN